MSRFPLHPSPPRRFRAARVLLAAVTIAVLPASLAAQGSGAGDGIRIGISLGGISTVGVSVEWYDDTRSYDLSVGTWSFRDVSVSLVVKEYFGASALRPFVGAGLWVVAAAPAGERLGVAAVVRAPVGVDWRVLEDHSLGAALNVNRALWVRRTDPEDDLPLNRRLVPLPGVYYRWGRKGS